MYKKSISPVVAVALLLIVSVIAVIGYQGWFSTYSSKIFSDTEIKSNSAISSVKINNLVGNKLFLLNPQKNITIKTIKLDNYDCNITESTYTDSLIEITIPDFCLGNITTNTPYVTVITNEEILDYKVFLKGEIISSTGSVSSPLNCSDLGLNGGEWVTVPSDGPGSLVSEPFCVMKYEAKEDSSGLCLDGATINCPISQSSGNPWISISRINSILECKSLGSGNYHLITDAQWVTIARLIENDLTNWNNSVVGNGAIFRGNVNLINTIGCGSNSLLTGDIAGTNCLSGSRNKRTLNISGNLIWDFSGNVWEWTNSSLYSNGMSSLGKSSSDWYEWTTISGYDYLESTNPTYNSLNGIGKAYADFDDAYPSGTTHAIRRGGYWDSKEDAGIFSINLLAAPDFTSIYGGFRCAYTP